MGILDDITAAGLVKSVVEGAAGELGSLLAGSLITAILGGNSGSGDNPQILSDLSEIQTELTAIQQELEAIYSAIKWDQTTVTSIEPVTDITTAIAKFQDITKKVSSGATVTTDLNDFVSYMTSSSFDIAQKLESVHKSIMGTGDSPVVQGTSVYQLFMQNLVDAAKSDPANASLITFNSSAQNYLKSLLSFQLQGAVVMNNCLIAAGDSTAPQRMTDFTNNMKAQLKEFTYVFPGLNYLIETADTYGAEVVMTAKSVPGKVITFDVVKMNIDKNGGTKYVYQPELKLIGETSTQSTQRVTLQQYVTGAFTIRLVSPQKSGDQLGYLYWAKEGLISFWAGKDAVTDHSAIPSDSDLWRIVPASAIVHTHYLVYNQDSGQYLYVKSDTSDGNSVGGSSGTPDETFEWRFSVDDS